MAGPSNGGISHRSIVRTETYLDWSATAPLRPEAIAAMSAALARCGNPSSVHRWGRAARQMVESARAAVASTVGGGVEAADVVFVSGGTEANHLALLGAGRDRVLVSAIEHHSVLEAVPQAETIPVERSGVLSLDALERLLTTDSRPALVSVMLANNETGVIQPVREAAAIAHRHGALFHCDAVQAAGKMIVDAAAVGADLLSLSAHKLGGPPGIGALIATGERDLKPLFRGGGQERGRRPGTENLPGIAGFAAAAVAAAESMAVYDRLRLLRDEIERSIVAVAPDAVVLGGGAPRLPHITAIAMPGVAAATQIMALDLEGVMVSAGAACSSGKVGPSHVLAAMGVKPAIAGATIRVSLGWTSSETDIANFLRAWTALYRRRRVISEGSRAA